jgi:hypothetical protein
MSTPIVLVILAALLVLPIAHTASPVAAKQRSRTVTRTFANTAPIRLPGCVCTPDLARLYPSPIAVSGLKGTIHDVNLTLNTFSHQVPSQVQVLLVGPRGQTAIVMADVGANNQVTGVTLRLDDEAGARLPDTTASTLESGTFRPTNALNSAIDFKDPAPPVTRANATLSVFDGSNPNGTWRLFVMDSNGPFNPGNFEGGWTLEIQAKIKANKKKR